MEHKGILITFEKTCDGLGGTTQARHLYERLQKAGYDAILTKEPGGTLLGTELRRILLHGDYSLSKATELFLMMADRAQHYKEVLKPALKEGKVVISDRYFDSTLVYQGSARGWKSAFLWRLHHAATGSLLPDLTFVLDGTPHRQRSQQDRFERESDEFYAKVKRGMLHLATKSSRYVVCNANVGETALTDEIWNTTLRKLEELRNTSTT